MIGVCLKYQQRNYGSQLQARATIKILEDVGLDYRILQYNKKGIWFKIKNIYRVFNPIFLNDRIQDFYKSRSMSKHPQIVRRNKLFDNYSKKWFGEKTVSLDYYSDLQKYANSLDAVITCSDQLWSPAALGTNFYNLMFVPNKVRKISLASSFGVGQIPKYQIKATKRYLERIDYISMRENRGAEIVKELVGREVPVLMDPVFAYTKEEWEEIVPPKQIYDFPYIFCYYLGNNISHRKMAEEFAKEIGLKIVALKYQDSYLSYDSIFGDICPFEVDSDDFLNIIRGANYILTDSFHGCAFSVICEKEFFVFNRYVSDSVISKNTRLDTLCENLGLQDRRIMGVVKLSNKLQSAIDYSKVKYVLSGYIKKTKDYINNAFVGII